MKVFAPLFCADEYHWMTPSPLRHGHDDPPAGCFAACPPSGSRIADAGVPARAADCTAPSSPVIVAASIGPLSTSEPARNPWRGLVVPPPRYFTASRCDFTEIVRADAFAPTNDSSCAPAAFASPVAGTPSTWLDGLPLHLASM